jgi:hypothetical protein
MPPSQHQPQVCLPALYGIFYTVFFAVFCFTSRSFLVPHSEATADTDAATAAAALKSLEVQRLLTEEAANVQKQRLHDAGVAPKTKVRHITSIL